jgi:transposase
MEAYPMSIRKKIIERYRAGESTQEIAERYGYCVSGVRRVRQRYEETGRVEPRKTKPGRKPALDGSALEKLSGHVTAQPDATLVELRQRMGIDVDLAVYCRALKKLGLTRKKSRFTPLSRIVRM